LPTGLGNGDPATVNIWKWDPGAMILVPLKPMNSGKLLTGRCHNHLLPSHHSMDGLPSNNTEIAMTPLNSPTPTESSVMVTHALWTVPLRDLTSLTGPSPVDIATASTWKWEHGAILLDLRTTMNSGKPLIGGHLSHLLLSHHSMVGLPSNNMVIVTTPLNSPTPTVPSALDMTASWTALLKDLMLPTGLGNMETVTVSTWQWEPGAMILDLLEPMNSGKPLTGGLLNHLLLSQHSMDGLNSNNTVTATIPPNSPTPTVPSLMVTHASWTAPLKDLMLPTGPSVVETAIANTWRWVPGATLLDLLTTMNSGTPWTGGLPLPLLPHQHSMDGLPSNNTVTATTTPNSPTPMVPSVMVTLASWIALLKDLTLPTGASLVDTAIASTTPWETGAIQLDQPITTNCGKLLTGGPLSHLLPVLSPSPSNNMEIAMTTVNSPTPTVHSPQDMTVCPLALTKDLTLPTTA